MPRRYIEKLLERYDMEDCKPPDTLMAEGEKQSFSQRQIKSWQDFNSFVKTLKISEGSI